MLNPSLDPDFTGKIDPPDAARPYGNARDALVENDPNATPLLAKKFNDDWGFDAALMSAAGITPSGDPDAVGASQRLEALKRLFAPRLVSVNIADYPTLKAAIAALPASGGVVLVPIGNFYAGHWTYDTDYMSKPNVSLVGEKMPTWNDDASALVGGSIIEGRFNAFADNFNMINIGFDLGKNVVAARFGGASTNAPDYPYGGGTWDAFAFAQPNMASPLPQRKAFRAENVICLCKRPTTLGHAFLSEGYDGGYINNVIGIYSVHATVIKAQNVRFGSIEGYMSEGEGLIIKSDSYTDCGHVQGSSVSTSNILHNCTPHEVPTTTPNGLQLLANAVPFSGPIQIDNVTSFGANIGLDILGTIGADIQIGQLLADGFGGTMTDGVRIGATGQFRRIQIGSFICNNSVHAVDHSHPFDNNREAQLHIGSLAMQNISDSAIIARDYGRVIVDSITGDNVDTVYEYVGDNSRIIVGDERMPSGSILFKNPITLSAGWEDYGPGQPPFNVRLANYGVVLSGLIRATATPSSAVSSLFANIKPTQDTRQLAYINRAGTRSFALINADATIGIGIDDGTAPLNGDYLSLDGVGWVI